MSDWQICHLLCEPQKEEPAPYNEVFFYAWKLRGYTEDEIEQIWQWNQVEKLSDEETWEKIKEAGFAR